MSEKSYKERVREEMINAAIQYKQVYVDYEYLICSEAFVEQDFYIVAGREDNEGRDHPSSDFTRLRGQFFGCAGLDWGKFCPGPGAGKPDAPVYPHGQSERPL